MEKNELLKSKRLGNNKQSSIMLFVPNVKENRKVLVAQAEIEALIERNRWKAKVRTRE